MRSGRRVARTRNRRPHSRDGTSFVCHRVVQPNCATMILTINGSSVGGVGEIVVSVVAQVFTPPFRVFTPPLRVSALLARVGAVEIID